MGVAPEDVDGPHEDCGSDRRGDRGATRQPRVVVVAGHAALSEALCNALEGAGFRAKHVPARSAGGLASRIVRSAPDVVVVGAETGDQPERMALIADIAEAGIPVVGLVGRRDDAARQRLIRRAGAKAVVAHSDPLAYFVETVGAVSSDSFEPQPVPVPHSDEERTREEHVKRLDRLSARELEILAHLRGGRTVREIASSDHVAQSTVRVQVASLLRKLEVSTQLAAVAISRPAEGHGDP